MFTRMIYAAMMTAMMIAGMMSLFAAKAIRHAMRMTAAMLEASSCHLSSLKNIGHFPGNNKL